MFDHAYAHRKFWGDSRQLERCHCDGGFIPRLNDCEHWGGVAVGLLHN